MHHKSWDGGPTITVDFKSDGFIVLGLQRYKGGQGEMLNGIHESWPEIDVWLKMKAKVGTKTTWNGYPEIGLDRDAIGSTFEKCPKCWRPGPMIMVMS
jgi:hypothetical protein